MTFHKPVGEETPYIWFGYGPQEIFEHTWGQVSESINDYPININTSAFLIKLKLEDSCTATNPMNKVATEIKYTTLTEKVQTLDTLCICDPSFED